MYSRNRFLEYFPKINGLSFATSCPKAEMVKASIWAFVQGMVTWDESHSLTVTWPAQYENANVLDKGCLPLVNSKPLTRLKELVYSAMAIPSGCVMVTSDSNNRRTVLSGNRCLVIALTADQHIDKLRV